MATGDLITGDWQIERNGVLFGDGTVYDIRQITGLAGAPKSASSDRMLSARHGAVAGEDYVTPRTVTIKFEIVSDESTLTAKLDVLTLAFAPSIDPVAIAYRVPGVAGGGVVTSTAHCRNRSVNVDAVYARGVATVDVQLSAADPRLYGLTQNLVTAGVDDVADVGIQFPIAAPLGFGGAIAPGSTTVTNAGNFAEPFVMRIYGPCTDPVVTRAGDGLALSFTTTIADGDYLELNTAFRTVKLNGVTNQYSVLDGGSTWFDLVPGGNDLRLTRTGADVSRLYVYSFNAYV
jgi:hypothetical protein